MNKDLAKTLTTALVQFIDRERPEGTMCCSNAECESIEQMFEGGCYDIVEAFIRKKLTGLTEFEEKLVAFALQCEGDDAVASKEAKKWSHELLALAKKQLARQDEVITLDNLIPYDKGFHDGKAEAMADLKNTLERNHDKLPLCLKNEIERIKRDAYTRGYNKGHKDAEDEYNKSVAYHCYDGMSATLKAEG